jgi:serine/threonine protein kinase
MIADKYRIERRLARGGQATVYLASQLPLNRPVALKILSPPSADMTVEECTAFEQRFLLEARTLAALDHPNIVTVFDYGEIGDGRFYLAMEYIDGKRFLDLLRDGRLDPSRAVDLTMQVCRALRYAHKHGVVHRDVKNSNVLVRIDDNGREQVKVVDFGLVKLARVDTSITQTGMILGSPHFMAPEQATGDGVDHRVDIYATGVLLYCGLTGEYPFDGPHATAIITAHMTRTAPRFQAVVPEARIAEELEAIVTRCLEKQADQRYPSMEALIADLSVFHVDGPVEGVSGEFHTLTAHPAIRKWDWTVLGTGVVVGGVLAVILTLIGIAGILLLQLEEKKPLREVPVQVAPAPEVTRPEPPPAKPAPVWEEAVPARVDRRKPTRVKAKADEPPPPKPRAKPAPRRKKKPRTDLRDPWGE